MKPAELLEKMRINNTTDLTLSGLLETKKEGTKKFIGHVKIIDGAITFADTDNKTYTMDEVIDIFH